MTPQSRTFLDNLARTRLFANVGQPPPSGFDVKLVESWRDVFDPERSTHFENVRLAAQGTLTTYLSNFHSERDQMWNQLVREMRPEVAAIVNPACEALSATRAVNVNKLAAMTRSACVSVCMEYEYADLRPVGFFHRLGELYLLGRCPCGMQGEYPTGILEIY